MEESQELLEKATRERIRKNGFMLHNHIELESVERDRAVFKLDIRPESCNPYGMVHGGAIYTLADNATGTAAHSDGRYYVTKTSALHFLRRNGPRSRAENWGVSASRRTRGSSPRFTTLTTSISKPRCQGSSKPPQRLIR